MRTAVLLLACSLAALASAQELVTNGGFETGDFAGWTQFGDTGATSVWDFNPHGGTYCAYFGPADPGGIQQTLAVNAGTQVHVSFWYLSEGGVTPNSLALDLGGQNLLSLQDITNTNWVEFATDFTVPVNNPDLVFTLTNPPDYTDLDDISVTVVPEPASLLLVGLAGLVLRRR